RGDIAEEGRALFLAEEDVVAQEGLREAVDRGQRRAQLAGDTRDELGLHLLDDALRGDVAEGEDPTGNGSRRIAHDRLRQREPDLVRPAPDRDEALSGRGVARRLELA